MVGTHIVDLVTRLITKRIELDIAKTSSKLGISIKDRYKKFSGYTYPVGASIVAT